MFKIFVVIEHRNQKIKNASLEIVSGFSKAGHEVHGILLGEGVTNLVPQVGHAGATSVHLVENAALKMYSSETYTQAVTEISQKHQPDYVLASHTPTGRDFMPRVAVRLNAGIASDCSSIKFEGSNVTFKRPIFAGKALGEVDFKTSGTRVVTLRPNALGSPSLDTGKTCNLVNESISFGPLKTKVIEIVQGNNARPDVTEASIVVSGGRSVKSADGFKPLEEMADALGAAVGASRAAVDAGYRPHRDQVGQTGKVVSPSLYIACGISGAIQHLAGMRTSKVIVAINTDPEAPIFQVADYGIVGDIFQAVPQLTAEFKKAKEQ